MSKLRSGFNSTLVIGHDKISGSAKVGFALQLQEAMK